MKGTITMLVVLVTLLTTWLSLALLGWAFSDTTFKACATHGGTLMVMLIFGWIPAVIVAVDLDDYFDNKKYHSYGK